ncbi:hypothetical protein AUP68_13140 [Ilyonectria robusta]
MNLCARIIEAFSARKALYFSVFRRQTDQCSGWNCLTTAQRFGIIFSIVVTSVVLILAYMYYLGRITSSHQELVLARRRSRRRHRRYSAPNIVMGQLPIHQQHPSFQSTVMYQPVLCNPGGVPVHYPLGHFSPGRLPAPGHLPAGQVPQPPIPMVYPVPPYQSRNPQRNFQPEPHRGGSARISLSPSSMGSPPRQPTWRQRLSRVFALPVGRVSTVASSSAPGTPIRSRSQSTVTLERGGQTTPRLSSRSVQEPSHNHRGRIYSVSPTRSVRTRHTSTAQQSDESVVLSPRTDVATVHSDDFELQPTPVSAGQVTPSYHLPITASGNGAANSNSSFESNIYSDDRHYLPSVSSCRSGWSPDSRSITPVTGQTDPSFKTNEADILSQLASAGHSNGYTTPL